MDLVELYNAQQNNRVNQHPLNCNEKLSMLFNHGFDYGQYGLAQLGRIQYNILINIHEVNIRFRILKISDDHRLFGLIEEFMNRLQSTVGYINTSVLTIDSNALGAFITIVLNPSITFFEDYDEGTTR